MSDQVVYGVKDLVSGRYLDFDRESFENNDNDNCNPNDYYCFTSSGDWFNTEAGVEADKNHFLNQLNEEEKSKLDLKVVKRTMSVKKNGFDKKIISEEIVA